MDKVHVEIVLRLKDRFSHEEFLAACTRYGVKSIPIDSFAQYNGMLHCAMSEWPKMDPYDAMRQFIVRMNELNKEIIAKLQRESGVIPNNTVDRQSTTIDPTKMPPMPFVPGVKSGCGHCGGKK